jgi:hypothetical protein
MHNLRVLSGRLLLLWMLVVGRGARIAIYGVCLDRHTDSGLSLVLVSIWSGGQLGGRRLGLLRRGRRLGLLRRGRRLWLVLVLLLGGRIPGSNWLASGNLLLVRGLGTRGIRSSGSHLRRRGRWITVRRRGTRSRVLRRGT